ncbi:DUF485 domain-containing protein [Streptomyces sp. adm13(2018)]|uniref:DUF485 domain-containing protein n=1 Tax=Streptomyces sp. adm13(2018) TaxID=2479007 RepID=UPI0011CE09D1|nr:DUF485 domain-containing protein [Streptomyces sp. adm13(2018)]TXS07980.1 DUF485 domain-containing protein [Streptomyces sp. adm13(2018)]
MSYHQPFPGPPPVPHRNAGRHRQEATPHPWSGEPPSWDTDPQAARESSARSWEPVQQNQASVQQHQASAPQPWDSTQQPWDAAPSPQPPAVTDQRDDLHRLGSAYRRLRRVATFTALGYFVVFLLLSGYAPSLMTGTLTGGLTTGLVLGLLQLPVALAAIAVYERIARRRVDPLAATIRQRAERAAEAAEPRPERRSRSGRPGWQQPVGGGRA